MKRLLLILIMLYVSMDAKSQVIYEREIPVTITGLSFDAMEPFISPDGQTLFYNSLNDGINTSLYFASRTNDSTFQHEGVVLNVNQPAPHLDAVASIDIQSRFYWVSTRDYPSIFQNLMTGTYVNGVVTDISHVYGDFYVYSPGWLVMDAAITSDGNNLVYCNAYFNNCTMGLPCKASLGMAEKVNDTTFMKAVNSASLFANVNDTSFLVYAPQLSTNGLELYYTRLEKNTTETQICVSVRTDTTQAFPAGTVLYSNTGAAPEAPTISTDMTKMYYHRKDGNQYRIFLKMRTLTSADKTLEDNADIYPNPATDKIYIENSDPLSEIRLMNLKGSVVYSAKAAQGLNSIDTKGFPPGSYLVSVIGDKRKVVKKIIIIADTKRD